MKLLLFFFLVASIFVFTECKVTLVKSERKQSTTSVQALIDRVLKRSGVNVQFQPTLILLESVDSKEDEYFVIDGNPDEVGNEFNDLISVYFKSPMILYLLYLYSGHFQRYQSICSLCCFRSLHQILPRMRLPLGR